MPWREPGPKSPKRQGIRDRIAREARIGRPGIVAPPAVVPAERVTVPFAVGDEVLVFGTRRGVVLSVRPDAVVVNGMSGWVPLTDVEPYE